MSATFESTLRIALFALFALAAFHKIRVLARGKAGDEPLIATSAFRRRYASQILAGVATAELALAASLVVIPAEAMAAAAGLLVFYAVELRRLAPDESCRCLGDAFGRTSARSARYRNVVLAVVSSSASAAMYIRGSAAPLHLETGVGVTLLLLAIAAGLSSAGFTLNHREVHQ
ncbi:MAG TPA: MauE/DoxX family redox-associated membrane protein [Gaiellaceae bacterium]|nr:MauE/DoxX family redox-associated membrane protein [Gaiellaceae bacterium]